MNACTMVAHCGYHQRDMDRPYCEDHQEICSMSYVSGEYWCWAGGHAGRLNHEEPAELEALHVS